MGVTVAALGIVLVDMAIVGMRVWGVGHPPAAAYALMFMPFVLVFALSFRRRTTPLGVWFWSVLLVHVAISVYIYWWGPISAALNGVSTGLNVAAQRTLQSERDDHCYCEHGVRQLFGCNARKHHCASCNTGYELKDDNKCQLVSEPVVLVDEQQRQNEDQDNNESSDEGGTTRAVMSVGTPAIHQRNCGSCLVSSAALVLAIQYAAQFPDGSKSLQYYPSVERLREILQTVEQEQSRRVYTRNQKHTHSESEDSFVTPYICEHGMAYLSSWTVPAGTSVRLPAVPVADINTCETASIHDGTCAWAHLHYTGESCGRGDKGTDGSAESKADCTAYHKSNYNRPTTTSTPASRASSCGS